MPHRPLLALGRLAAALGAMAALAACGADNALQQTFSSGSGAAYDYAALELELVAPAGPGIAASVIDRRPYVLEGDESPRFVGTGPGRYHNTVDVSTLSGRPLAELVTEAVARALERRGIAASAVPLEDGTERGQALAALRETGAGRLLLVEIGEWQTNSQIRVAARWQLEATVYDGAGEVLGRRTRQGAARPARGAGPLAVAALASQLELLLNDPAIAGALAPSSGPT